MGQIAYSRFQDEWSHRDYGPSAVLIIGASLTGLTFALACAMRGIRTLVLERTLGRRYEGGALGINRSLLMRAVGLDPHDTGYLASFPPLIGYRQATSWRAVHDWLRRQASKHPEITLLDGVTVVRITQDNLWATAITSDGQQFAATVAVGADGYRSIVRRALNPEQAEPLYAGYLLWRGLVSEADLPAELCLALGDDGVCLATDTGFRFVAYPVAGPDRSIEPGKRLISFAWYDATRCDLLRRLNCLSETGEVFSSLAPYNIPETVTNELREIAGRIWPDPWRSIVIHALQHRTVFATPVAEYLPTRLTYGRLAVIGDAGHLVSPKLGQGFVAGISDADCLARALGSAFDAAVPDLSHALEIFEDKRLPIARKLVSASIEKSRIFRAKAIGETSLDLA